MCVIAKKNHKKATKKKKRPCPWEERSINKNVQEAYKTVTYGEIY